MIIIFVVDDYVVVCEGICGLLWFDVLFEIVVEMDDGVFMVE